MHGKPAAPAETPTTPGDLGVGSRAAHARWPLSAALLASLALALGPTAALADSSGWGVRLGVEAPFSTHADDPAPGQPRTLTIGDSFQPTADLILEQTPKNVVAFGLEGRWNFASSNGAPETGVALGPEMTLNIPVIPLYARLALPVRVQPHIGELGLRVAAGFKLKFSSFGVYMEGVGDAPLFGVDANGRNERPFSRQTISIGGGVELSF